MNTPNYEELLEWLDMQIPDFDEFAVPESLFAGFQKNAVLMDSTRVDEIEESLKELQSSCAAMYDWLNEAKAALPDEDDWSNNAFNEWFQRFGDGGPDGCIFHYDMEHVIDNLGW